MRDFSNFLEDESGVTALEYALIIAFTAMALILVMPGIGSKLSAIFGSIVSNWL
jgi:pilus assembly protein Flp/PilA